METAMKNALLLALLVCSLLSAAACTHTPTNLHPIAGTREGAEQFKDDSTN
jgi:hypothetical protein